LFARRLGRKAPQQDQQRLGGLTGVTPLTLYRAWILGITRAWGAEICHRVPDTPRHSSCHCTEPGPISPAPTLRQHGSRLCGAPDTGCGLI
jgi:hypothetical protein